MRAACATSDPGRSRHSGAGRPEKGGPVAILGAGTGLGQAGVLPDGDHDVVVASEAGRVDFGPRTAQQGRLVDFLRARFGRATRERVLSGSGLELVYEFLAADGAARPNRAVTARPARRGRRRGGRHQPPRARAAGPALARGARPLGFDLRLGGGQRGPAVPRHRGPLRIAGGIAAKILPALKRPGFLRALHDKAPMRRALVAGIPVRVVLDANLGLYGAAAAALAT